MLKLASLSFLLLLEQQALGDYFYLFGPKKVIFRCEEGGHGQSLSDTLKKQGFDCKPSGVLSFHEVEHQFCVDAKENTLFFGRGKTEKDCLYGLLDVFKFVVKTNNTFPDVVHQTRDQK
jgi:hypothetical protein